MAAPTGWGRRWLRGLLLLLLLVSALLFVLGRETVLQALLPLVLRQAGLDQSLQIRGIHGSMWGPLTLDRIEFDQPAKAGEASGQHIGFDNLALNWQPRQLLQRRLQIDSLTIGKLRFAGAGSGAPPTLPKQLGLPFELQLTRINIDRLEVVSGPQTLVFQEIQLGLASTHGRWEVRGAHARLPLGALQLDAGLQQTAPFGLQGKAQITADSLILPLEMSGTLGDLHVQGNTGMHDMQVQAGVDLTLFDAFPLRTLQMKVQHLNPALWRADLPQAQLDLALDAQRKNGAWQGQLQLENSASGALDAQRLPLQHGLARIEGRDRLLQLQDLVLDFGAGGQFRGQLDWDANQPLAPALHLHTTNLNLQGWQQRLRATRIAGDIRLKPLQGQWQLLANLAQQGLQLDLQASLQQQHLQLQLARLRAGGGVLQLAGAADLAAPGTFSASGQMLHFDPAQFGRYPAADLNADLALKGQGGKQWQLGAQGKLRPSRLLQHDLLGQVALQLDADHIHNLDLDLHFGSNFLRAKGAMGAAKDQVQWQLDAQDLNALGWAGKLQATGVASGGTQAARSTLELTASDLRKLDRAASAGSRVHAQGELQLTPVAGIKLNLDASHLNPAAWGAYPAADLNGKLQLHGQAGANWQGGIDLQLQPGSLLDKALSGHVLLDLAAGQVRAADVALQWGANQLGINQADIKPLDIKQVGAASASSGQTSPGAGFDWHIEAPQLLAQLTALKAASSNGQAPAPATASAQQWNLQAHGRWQGGMAAHTLSAQLGFGHLQADWVVAGGWQAGQGWQGALQSLRASGGVNLQAPLQLQWQQAKQQLNLQPALVQFDGGSLRLDALEWAPQQWRTRGSVHGLPLAALASFKPEWQERLGGGLRLGFEWDLNAGEHVNGKLRLMRDSGDWQPGLALPQGLGLQTLLATLDLQQDQLQLNFAVKGKQVGQAQLAFGTRLGRRDGSWGVPGNSPLQLQASASFDSIAWLAGLSNDQISCDGNLTLQVQGGGSIASPVFSGSVDGGQLALRYIKEGLQLKNGALHAVWQGQQLQVQDLHFDGLIAQGNLHFADARLALHMALQASQLALFSRPDRLLVVSGESVVDLDEQGLRLSGKLRADRAMLELLAQDTPTLSQDIRLLRGKRVLEKPNPVLPLRVQLELDLGEQFQVKGQGLDARLTGKLNWQALERRGPRLVGEVQVAEGNYRAYGQKLFIDRGAISFSGVWDNPGLNVLAMRQRLDPDVEVDVGIELRGTLLAPQVRLVSTPPLPDSEKLAWLVLGHGLEGSAGQEMDMLGVASSAFFGSARDNVANKLGLDEVGVSYAKGLENAVFTLGKRLSSRAFLSFEQGLGSATGLVKLRYSFNPRLSVQLQTGSNNAVDVFYSWRFD